MKTDGEYWWKNTGTRLWKYSEENLPQSQPVCEPQGEA